MKKEKLMDAMNDLDDTLIESAAPRATAKRRAILVRYAAVAACLALVVCAVILGLPKAPAPVDPTPTPGVVHPVAPPIPSDPSDGAVVDQTYSIYFLDNDTVECETVQTTSMTAREQFFRWCELNGIDAAHCFINFKLTSNGRVVEIYEGDVVHTIQEPGDRLIVKLTVSAEFENYLPEEMRESLLQTLELTFCEGRGEAEYQLILK